MDSDEPIYCLEAEMDMITFAWRPCVRNEEQVNGIEMARKSHKHFDIVYVTHDG